MRQRALTALTFCLLTLLGTASPSVAQAQTWQPAFQPDRHVYVDDALKNHASAPVDFSAMPTELDNLSKTHGLSVYIVAVQRDFPEGKVVAKEMLDELLDQWEARSDFPSKDFVVVLWVRQEHNPSKGSVAAGVGSKLKNWGFDAAKLADKVRGPVTPALRQFMPGNPEQALLQIVRNVNQGASVFLAAQEQAERERVAALAREKERLQAEEALAERQRLARIEAQKAADAAQESARTLLWGVMLGAAAAVVFIALFVYWLFKRSRSASLIAEYKRKFDNANTNYIQLESAYLDFLKAQGTDWKSKFKDNTLAVYSEAVEKFAALSVRMRVSQERLRQAETAHNGAYFLIPFGYSRAIALLTSEEITVSSENLPQETIKLFESVVTKKTCKPNELLAEMEQLFAGTNTALASIMHAFHGAEQNRLDIESLQKQITGMQKTLEDAGLSFAPYKARCDGVASGQQVVIAILTSDPLAAYSKSETVEADAGRIKSDIQRAVALKQTLGESETTVGTVVEQVKATRLKACNLAEYPEAGEEALTSSGKYLLCESGGNPDAALHEAANHLTTAGQLLMSGELDRAEAENQAALSSAQLASRIVQDVLAARAFVIEQLPLVRRQLKALTAKIPGGQTSVTALTSEFIAANFVSAHYRDMSQQFAGCQTSARQAENDMSVIRTSFYEQRFLAARKTLEAADSSIATASQQLVEIDNCLRALRDFKQSALNVVANAIRLSTTVKSKLAGNAFTTAQATSGTYEQLVRRLDQQKIHVVPEGKIDWVVASQEANSLMIELQSVESQIEREKQGYALAMRKFDELTSAIHAVRFDNDTRGPAQNRLRSASNERARLQLGMQIAGSDWYAIAREAEAAKSFTAEAQTLADQDRSAAATARRTIQEAETVVSGSNRSYAQTASWNGNSSRVGQNVAVDLRQPRHQLGQSKEYLQVQNYEGACTSAREAINSARQVQKDAEQAVALLVSAAILAWQQAELQTQQQTTTPAGGSMPQSSGRSGGPPIHYQPEHTGGYQHSSPPVTHHQSSPPATHHQPSPSDPHQQSHNSGGDNYGHHDSGSSHDTGGDNY